MVLTHEEILEKITYPLLRMMWLPALFFLAIPTALALFNQPTIDDYWYTFMVKEHGFWQAQVEWNRTINARYVSNAFMSLNSLVWGKTWFFKLFPIFLIGGYLVFFRLFSTVLFLGFNNKQHWQSGLILSCAYVVGMPGYYEGLYWSSALAGYQLAWLVVMGCFLVLFKRRYALLRPASIFVWLLVGTLAGGFHELAACIIIGLSAVWYLVAYFFKSKLPSAMLYFVLGALLALLIQVVSKGNFEKANIVAERRQDLDAVLIFLPLLQFCYHLVKGFLLNPIWWFAIMLIISGAQPALPFPLLVNRRVVCRLFVLCAIVVAISIFPTLFVGYTEGATPPLRVINLGYGILFVWIALLTVVVCKGLKKFLNWRPQLAIHRQIIASLCFALLLVKTYDLYQPIISGTAYSYHRQVERRFKKISESKGKRIVVNCLTAQPAVLCPFDVCDDPTLLGYLERVFQKQIDLQDSLVLKPRL